MAVCGIRRGDGRHDGRHDGGGGWRDGLRSGKVGDGGERPRPKWKIGLAVADAAALAARAAWRYAGRNSLQ